MSLAIFDLDNTLLAGDSDYLWGEYLIEQNLVDKDTYKLKNQQFYDDYKRGKLDIYAFLEFALEPLKRLPYTQLVQLRADYLRAKIEPILLPQARTLVESHRNKQHELLIITATNSFITKPIAELFGIDNLLASDPEMLDGEFTGKVQGTPCYQNGKVIRLLSWLQSKQPLHEETSASSENTERRVRDMLGKIGESWFYSDSHNDLPLLRTVDNPIAVDPDPELTTISQKNNWKIISLR